MTASAGPALKRLDADFGDRVAFATLYVREAHPGEHYPQPDSFEQKLAHARVYQARDQIPWPVAVDNVEGDLHRALTPKPNAAYLMDTGGNVAFRALWSNDERVLRQGLEAFLAEPLPPVGERTPRLIPLMKGMGMMYELLSFSGPQAKQDVRRELLPMYAMARLAAFFRPLPPLGRGLAATGISLGGLMALAGGLRWALRRRG